MRYHIIGDSCTDMPEYLKSDPRISIVPLTLEIGDYRTLDGPGRFDQADFLRRVKESPVGPKSACPSPEAYRQAIADADAEEIFIITLSSHLSGSYQSAVVGKQMFEEDMPDSGKQIHVFDSEAASSGCYLILKHIIEKKDAGCTFEEVVSEVTEQLLKAKTWFVLETLEVLRKNGRLSNVKAILATALNIKPVMRADHGVIFQQSQKRGINNALKSMVQEAVNHVGGPDACRQLDLVISHVNNPDRAAYTKAEFEKLASYRSITILDTMGVATTYACDGGIIVTL